MLISRDDPRFWDVRSRERRIRSGELLPTDLEAHLSALVDVADKATISTPLEEPDERAHERLMATPRVRLSIPEPLDDDLDDLDDIDDEDEDDDDLDDEDDDEDEDDDDLDDE